MYALLNCVKKLRTGNINTLIKLYLNILIQIIQIIIVLLYIIL